MYILVCYYRPYIHNKKRISGIYVYTYTEHYSDMNFFYIVCMVYACDDFSVIAMCMHYLIITSLRHCTNIIILTVHVVYYL